MVSHPHLVGVNLLESSRTSGRHRGKRLGIPSHAKGGYRTLGQRHPGVSEPGGCMVGGGGTDPVLLPAHTAPPQSLASRLPLSAFHLMV